MEENCKLTKGVKIMTNSEIVINGVSLKETIEELELLFDEFHNEEFCTLARSRDYMESLSEENDKLKAENERLSRELKSEREWCPNTRIETFDKKTEIEQLRTLYGIR